MILKTHVVRVPCREGNRHLKEIQEEEIERVMLYKTKTNLTCFFLS